MERGGNMKCCDCADEISKENQKRDYPRRDLCDKCNTMRIEIMGAIREGKISIPDFQEWQKKGTTKYRRGMELLGKPRPTKGEGKGER
jgi:hypothetical protein